MNTETKAMLDTIVEDYNQKWIEAGGNHPISDEEALEIMIEDTYNNIAGYNYSWNEICKQRSN